MGECCLIWFINRNHETPQASKVGKRPLSSSCTTCTLRPQRQPCQSTRQSDPERTCNLCCYFFLAAWEVRMGPARGAGLGPQNAEEQKLRVHIGVKESLFEALTLWSCLLKARTFSEWPGDATCARCRQGRPSAPRLTRPAQSNA